MDRGFPVLQPVERLDFSMEAAVTGFLFAPLFISEEGNAAFSFSANLITAEVC